MKLYKLVLLNSLVLLGIFSNVRLIAAEENHNENLSKIPTILLQNLTSVNFEEEFIKRILSNIRQHSSDSINLTKTDVQKTMEKVKYQERIANIASFTRYDLNFDGFITKDEIVISIPMLNHERYPLLHIDSIEDTANRIMAADIDGDGNITKQEIIAKADLEFKQGAIYLRLIVGLEELLALDSNKDGKLTISELKAEAIAAFQAADTDQDGILSQLEKNSVHQILMKAKEKERSNR